MNDTQLRCFLAVAQTLNFARAAEQLHLSQPAVTRQIHTLERELGAQLLRRTTRTVRLTEAGQAFLFDAQRMVGIADGARRRFAQPRPEAVRVMGLSCPGWAQLFRLAQPLRTLCREFPGLRPRLQVLPSPALLRLLEEGELDAALSFRLESEGRARYRALCSVPLYCLFPSPADLPAAAALAPADLQPYPLVVMEPRRGGALSPLAAELAAGRSVRRLYFAASPEEALTLTDAGLGATVLPALFIPPQQMDRCVPLSGVPAASFGVYTRPEDADAPLRRLLALLAQLDWMTDRTPAAAAE